MSFAPHAASELRKFNYNTCHIENVPSIPPTFDGDVLFELPPINNPDGHSGQMQRTYKKYDGHSWCKVKTTNIKNDFNLTFHMTSCLGHLECQNHFYNYLVLNGNPNEIAWISDTIHGLNKDCFA
jgi:hypothetical protein